MKTLSLQDEENVCEDDDDEDGYSTERVNCSVLQGLISLMASEC